MSCDDGEIFVCTHLTAEVCLFGYDQSFLHLLYLDYNNPADGEQGKRKRERGTLEAKRAKAGSARSRRGEEDRLIE